MGLPQLVEHLGQDRAHLGFRLGRVDAGRHLLADGRPIDPVEVRIEVRFVNRFPGLFEGGSRGRVIEMLVVLSNGGRGRRTIASGIGSTEQQERER